jgi:hypothetical protein
MAFEVYSSGNQQTEREDRPQVDWDALNRYVIETANLEQRETLVGYVAAIVDLGTQEQEDAEAVFTGSAEDEAAAIEKHPDTYFKDGVDQRTKKPVRLKCWPQKPQQSVVLAVDFPDIMLNKGQFIDDEEAGEHPLRLWMGNQFYLPDVGMVVGRPIPLKVTNIAPEGSKKPVWSFAPNHQLYKMATYAKLIAPGEPFLPKDIDKLLGVSLQFEAQVYMKKNAKNGKEYYTEYVSCKTGLGRGQVPCEVVETPIMIQFNQVNKEEDIKNLRNHVVNTIRRASNFEGSMIQKQLSEVRPEHKIQEAIDEADSPDAEFISNEDAKAGWANKRAELEKKVEAKPAAKPVKKAPLKAADFDEDSVPF